MIGVLAIVLLALTISVYSIQQLKEQGEPADNLTAFNEAGFITTIGFSIYTYEGIGVVMPIMQNCDSPNRFGRILVSALISLTSFYIIFAEIVLITYGDEIGKT